MPRKTKAVAAGAGAAATDKTAQPHFSAAALYASGELTLPEIKICQTIVSTSTKVDTWTLQTLRTRKLQKFNCRRLHADTREPTFIFTGPWRQQANATSGCARYWHDPHRCRMAGHPTPGHARGHRLRPGPRDQNLRCCPPPHGLSVCQRTRQPHESAGTRRSWLLAGSPTAAPGSLCLGRSRLLVAKTAFLVGASQSLKKAGLLDDVTRRFLLLLDDTFVEETQQPRFGLWIGDIQRSCHLGVFHWDLE